MARTAPAGYMARRIESLRAQGMTRPEIEQATGIGPRTQRKLRTGQTSGAKLIQRQIKEAKKVKPGPRERGTLAVLVKDENGKVHSVDIIAPQYTRAKRLSPLDQQVIAAEPKVKTVVESELQRKRGGSDPLTRAQVAASSIVGVRVISRAHYASIPLVML